MKCVRLSEVYDISNQIKTSGLIKNGEAFRL